MEHPSSLHSTWKNGTIKHTGDACCMNFKRLLAELKLNKSALIKYWFLLLGGLILCLYEYLDKPYPNSIIFCFVLLLFIDSIPKWKEVEPWFKLNHEITLQRRPLYPNPVTPGEPGPYPKKPQPFLHRPRLNLNEDTFQPVNENNEQTFWRKPIEPSLGGIVNWLH